MPIINGQKMACEPCIRGHRSTKCNHSPDRMMIPVRKPGRPLSTCPHPPGRTCQCGPKVTVALPKGAACRCGGEHRKANGTAAIVKAEPAENPPPMSPTRHASFRIQKSSVPRQGRRPSVDTSALERMDPNSVNLIGAANIMSAAPGNAMGQISSAASAHYSNYVPPPDPWAFSHSTMPRDTTMESSLLTFNVGAMQVPQTPSSGNGISGPSDSSGTLTPGTSGSPYHTPTSSNGDLSSQEPSMEGIRSCCSPQTQPQSQMQPQPRIQPHVQPSRHIPLPHQLQTLPQEPSNMMGYVPQVPTPNGSMMPQFSQPSVNTMNNAVDFQQQSLYPTPFPYGTPHYPLQQEQWEQVMANFQHQLEPNGGAQNPFTSHVCDCGPDCQCLGCTIHPYNQATRQLVRELMTVQSNYADGQMDSGNSMVDPPLAAGESSPPPTHSPSDAESPNANDLSLSPSEYLFVDYGGGVCGCGDDCACINCLIHRDSLSTKNPGEPPDAMPN
ncbi:hypothetical protein F4677DRAFT_218070 [Hypoxylon crocopeplum]|nr:hypothetical protein F4677DRAFT_218070 [Hypoxylon crocopeplum]